jgi:Ca2+-binding RTX toxin-like protein
MSNAAAICQMERLETRVLLSAAPVGPEIQVNTTVVGDQLTESNVGAVAMDSAGNYVVTWTSDGQDGDLGGVYAQRFDALGVAQGAEFQVNTTVAGDQSDASVAMDAAGNFVITWTSNGQDGDGDGVYARVYSALGVPSSGEILVNTTTTGNQNDAAIAMHDTGVFVITWTSSGQDGDLGGIYAQQFSALGAAVGTETLVNTTTTGDQTSSAVALDALGNGVVTWTSTGTDGDLGGIYAQRFNALGVAQGSEILVNTETSGDQSESSLAMSATGEFVVAWTSNGQDSGGDGVFAQKFDALGVADGLELQVNTTVVGAQNGVAVAVDAAGYLVFTWTSDGQDGSLTGVYGQVYTDAGVASGSEFQVNTTTAGTQQGASVASNSEGGFVVVYTSDAQDTDGLGVFAQQFELTGVVQLDGTVLNVYGTVNLDTITVTDDSVDLVVVMNGDVFTYSSIAVTALNIYGRDGNDYIQIDSLTSDKALQVFGEGGNDTIRVSSDVTGDALLDGGDGRDLLVGGSGNDTLVGGADNDWLDGGDGFDMLSGGTGSDVYAFRETLNNQLDTVVELVDEGTDLLHFASMESAVTVDLTSDTLLATMANRVVSTQIVGQAANFENVFGGNGDDTIVGNDANNLIHGNGGIDSIFGGVGNDQLEGGDGNDLLFGQLGNDLIRGNADNDTLDGGEGYDSLVGGTGDDVYAFGTATVNQIDTIVELVGEGVDTLSFESLTTGVTVNLTRDTSLATMAQRIVRTGTPGQAANLENVIGGSANDHFTGNLADNILWGHDGNDTLIGGAGNDILLGGNGSDLMKGISGRNLLFGGVGADLLQAGTGGSVMLSGSYDFESDVDVLNSLLLEWSLGTSYQSRVDHLQGTAGGANAGNYLDINTAANDANKDYLEGGSGEDFYLASFSQDVLINKEIDEIFTHIDTWV